MLCRKPYRGNGGEYGCGRCLPCLLNRRRLWTSRIVLEALEHRDNVFWTGTYEDRYLPEGGNVSVLETRLFLERLRRRVGSFRYFIVGEYGERSWRPHYHAALFGVRDGRALRESWKFGFVHVSGLGFESAAYLAGYTCKRMTQAGDPRLGGRSPEFARMSLKPGLGAGAASRIGAFYRGPDGARILKRDGDVSAVVRQRSRLWPLGRYLVRRIRLEAGLGEEDVAHVNAMRGLRRQVEIRDAPELVAQREHNRVTGGARAEGRARREQISKEMKRETI